MDKFKSLLEKMGASSELIDTFCEELGTYKDSVKQKYHSIYESKLNKAKKICLEEVEKEKLGLSRKVGVFLESQRDEIRNHMTRQLQNEETEHKAKLQQVASILESANLNAGGEDSHELQKLKKTVERSQALIRSLSEEKEQLSVRANRMSKIGESLLEHNRALSSQLTEAGVQPISEGLPDSLKKHQFKKKDEKAAAPAEEDCDTEVKEDEEEAMAESKTSKSKEAISEGKGTKGSAARRLDRNRVKSGEKKSTSTLNENVNRNRNGSTEIDNIASSLPENI